MNRELKKIIEDSHGVHTGMKVDDHKSQYTVWKNKAVYDSKMLYRFDAMDGIVHERTGRVSLNDKIQFDGHPTLLMHGDNREKLAINKLSFTDWPGGSNIAHLDMNNIDLSEYNRISMWVYADAPTRPNTWLFCVMCNGEAEATEREGLDSRTGFNIPSNEWYQVFWEFTGHTRDKVREFVIVHEAEGVMPGDDADYNIYLADLKAEKVDADVIDGWELGDRIAYSQIGFLPDAPKQAVVQNADGAEFTVVDAKSQKVVYSGHMQWDGFILEEDSDEQDTDFFKMATKDALGHWFRAGVEAQAALVFSDRDERYAKWCLIEAEEDFRFGLENESEGSFPLRMGNTAYHELQQLSRKGYAATVLYSATGKSEYLDIAAETAKSVLNCQQTELPDWDKPLRGFFYCEQAKKTIAQYEHQSAEQAPIVFLVRLLETAPDHPDAENWRAGCQLYAEYLKKTADAILPFGLLPSAIYGLDTEPFERMLMMEGEDHVRKLYHDSIINGIRLSNDYYLRRMPVSSTLLRGFFAPVFAKATACAELGRLFKDKELRNIALDQVAWTLGKNPFARSNMYGEGYGFQPLYTPYSPDMVGAIPVGIQSNGTKDAPFLPSDNRPTFNEVWIHSSARFMATMASLAAWI